MADKPVAEVVAVDAALDALVSPTSSDVYEALQPFSNDAVAAVAAKRAAAGGGGGGGGGEVVTLEFAFDTTGLVAGVEITTLEVGDALFGSSGDAAPPDRLTITEPWDGTTPVARMLLDNGVDAPYAPWGEADMTLPDDRLIGGGDTADLYVPRNFLVAQQGSFVCRFGPVSLLLQLDDGAAGDPGAAQGAAVYSLVVYRA